MLGYVKAYVPELKVREFQVYNGTYCGLCKTVGDRYGQVFRLGLSYDMTFLALLLGALLEEEPQLTAEHCVAHHIRKKPILRCSAQEYAADMMMILGWENLRDDLEDRDHGHRARDLTLAPLLRRAASKAADLRPEASKMIASALADLQALEKQEDPGTDLPAAAFGGVTEAAFGWEDIPDAGQKRAASAFGRSFGQWLYLLDAWDDLEDDLRSGAFNPFLTRVLRASPDGVTTLRQRLRPQAEALLYHHLGEMALAFDLMTIHRDEELLRNIILLGLRRKTDGTLDGKKDNSHAEQRSL